MAILDDAFSYVGKLDYAFGSNDIAGGSGDCSAFTQHVFAENGYTIGRDTRSQLQQGTEVSKDDLKPGDLVFFEGTYREGVSHVGIYAGNGKMVNLQNDGCKVDDISSGYWAEHYMTARRVADAGDVGIPNLNDYDDYITDTVINPGDGASAAGLTGWITSKLGTIVTVVCIIGVCLLAVFFIFKAIQSQVDIPTLDDLGDALNNVSTNGGGE